MKTEEIAIYYDASMCSACKGCQINCKQWNQLPSPMKQEQMPYTGSFESPAKNSGDTWLHMKFNEVDTENELGFGWAFSRESCQHCTDAACVAVCSTGACHKEKNGAVVIEKEKCVGCKYCVAACPFDIPKYRERDGVTRKCWLCLDRVGNGQKPACVSTCPTNALDFGPRDKMLKLANNRVSELKYKHPAAVVYGEHEMGGLHLISVLPYGAEAHGMPLDPSPHITTTLSQFIKPVMGVGLIGMMGALVASYIGGRGYQRDVDELAYDPAHREQRIVDTVTGKTEEDTNSVEGGK